MSKTYDISDNEKVQIFIHWLSCEGLNFVQMLTDEGKEKYKSSAGLFNILNR